MLRFCRDHYLAALIICVEILIFRKLGSRTELDWQSFVLHIRQDVVYDCICWRRDLDFDHV